MHSTHEISASVRLTRALVPARSATTVVTRMTYPAPAARVWSTLMFYEQIDERPPFYLRWLLPVPVCTEGDKSAVGDEARCIYETGYLIKRVTHIEEGRVYGFVVSEQELDVGGGMRLSGGDYTLRDCGDGTTEIALTTNYVSSRRPRWFWRPIEAFVCHTFHRHILRAMRRAVRERTR
jgi:hypothetical protein